MLFRCEFAVFFSKRVSMFFVILYILSLLVLMYYFCSVAPLIQGIKKDTLYTGKL